MHPDVSIVLPTYDRLGFLREAVGSVLAQTWPDWELIVVDDGSTDGTIAWIESLGDHRIVVIPQPHTGNQSPLRNLGIEKARAHWVAFLDSDDVWHSTKLERQLAFHRDSPGYRWSYTGMRLIDAVGREITHPMMNAWTPHSGWILPQLVAFTAQIALPSVMAERALLREAGGFDPAFLSAQDFELWFRLAERAEVGVIPEVLLDVRKHRNPEPARPDRALSTARIFRDCAARATDAGLREMALTRQAYKAVDAVDMFADAARWTDALEAWRMAFRVRPFGPFVYRAAGRVIWRRLAHALRPGARQRMPT